MTDPVKEQLSACLDGELAEAELDLLLKRLKRDPGLRESLGGYALVGEALRNRRPTVASAGFAARVSAAVAAETDAQTVRPEAAAGVVGTGGEPATLWGAVARAGDSGRSTGSPRDLLPRAGQSWLAAAGARWFRPAAGLAIAAGVAAIAVVSLQPMTQPDSQLAVSEPVSAAATASAATVPQGPSYTVPTNTGSSAPAFIPAARLTNYVVAHSEYSSPLARRTVLSGVLSDDGEEVGEEEVGAAGAGAATEAILDGAERAVIVTTSGNAGPQP